MNMRTAGKCLLISVIILLVAFFSFNFYIIKELNRENVKSSREEKPANIEDRIVSNVKHLNQEYRTKNPDYDEVFKRLQSMFKPRVKPSWSKSPGQLYKLVNQWPEENRIYPLYEPLVGELIRALQTDEIRRVDISPKGTQLKLQLLLSSNQTVVFKPKWYDRETIIEGSVYAGKDRFNSEIFAFFLGSLLQLNWTPIVVGRKLNAKDMFRLSSARLKKTFLRNETSYCFYGQCYYCDQSNLVCGHQQNNYELEGALLYIIPGKFTKRRSPWQRTYKDGVAAEWETNSNFCADSSSSVRTQLTSVQLLDLIDGAIFDFLIQNGDRHHYETRDDRLLLLDNGKGFGNPQKDFLDILAPLYQCCTLRWSTYQRLLLFTGGTLSETIKELSKGDAVAPILTELHYRAIERRLLLLFSAIDICKQRHGKKMFAPW